jgi:hypothetical protein
MCLYIDCSTFHTLMRNIRVVFIYFIRGYVCFNTESFHFNYGYNEPEDDCNYNSKHVGLVKNAQPCDKQELGWIQYIVLVVVFVTMFISSCHPVILREDTRFLSR